MECLGSGDGDDSPAYLLGRIRDVETVARLPCWIVWMTVSHLVKPRGRCSLRTWGAWEVSLPGMEEMECLCMVVGGGGLEALGVGLA